MNPFEMLKNAQRIKEQLAKVQEELEDLTATGSSGGSIVKVTMNGKFEIQSVYLDPIDVDPRDVPMLQDLIVAASRDAMSKVKEQLEARLGPMMGGLNIPGLNL